LIFSNIMQVNKFDSSLQLLLFLQSQTEKQLKKGLISPVGEQIHFNVRALSPSGITYYF